MVYIKTTEEHEYNHFNSALGVKVEGKEHYKKLMAEGGYIPYDEACKIAEDSQKNGRKEYKPSPELVSFLRQMKSCSDSKGNISLGGRAIAEMKKFGVNFDAFDKTLGNLDQEKGGFYE